MHYFIQTAQTALFDTMRKHLFLPSPLRLHLSLCLSLSLILCLSLKAQVVINEFQASNASTIADPQNGEFNDWIELYNVGNTAVDLTGWYLSDSDNPDEWAFPGGTIIPAKGFLLIWADGSGEGLHTSFKLGAGGEQIGLFNPNATKVSQVLFVEQPTDVSYGLKTDGTSPWGYFAKPTPGTSNNSSVFYTDYVKQAPVFFYTRWFL
jgi:hypothetical protein